MRKFIFGCIFLSLASISVKAQQDASLTKGETVKYIERKLKELDGTKVQYGNFTYELQTNVRFENNKLKIMYSLSRPNTAGNGLGLRNLTTYMNFDYSFNPMYVTYVSNKGGTVMLVLTKENMNAILHEEYGYDQYWLQDYGSTYKVMTKDFPRNSFSTDNVTLYSPNDADFQTKIGKALMHLRDLLKAEDDPF